MCGIYGILGQNVDVYRKILLAVLNQERGTDSVGFWNGSTRVRAADSCASALIGGRIPKYVFSTSVFLGHSRAASGCLSSGRNASKENAHPFKHGKTVGAHNGYINNWIDILRTHATPSILNSINVDSHAAIFLIDKLGLDAFQHMRGSGAMWWVRTDDVTKVYLWVFEKQLSLDQTNPEMVAFSSDDRHLKLCGFKRPILLDDNGQVLEIDMSDQSNIVVKKIGIKPGLKFQQVEVYNGSRTQHEFGFGFNDERIWSQKHNGWIEERCGRIYLYRYKADESPQAIFPSDTQFRLDRDAYSLPSYQETIKEEEKCVACGGTGKASNGEACRICNRQEETEDDDNYADEMVLEREKTILFHISHKGLRKYCLRCKEFMLPTDYPNDRYAIDPHGTEICTCGNPLVTASESLAEREIELRKQILTYCYKMDEFEIAECMKAFEEEDSLKFPPDGD